jgi:hypothetical protein
MNSLVKNTALGLQTSADVKVTADGSKIFATHYASESLKVTTNNGASWTTLLSGGGVGPSIDASDDGVVLVNGYFMSTNSGASWFGTPGMYYGVSYSHAVSGDGNVIMVVDWTPPTGVNRYYVSTNRGAFFTNTVSGSSSTPYLGWGGGFSCATRTGDRIYIATWGNPVGPDEGNIAYLEAPNYDTLNRITPGGESRLAYQSVSCSPDGRGVIALAERTASREGSAYVSTNYGATWSDATNLIDVGGGSTQPHWVNKCAWGNTFDGGYAVKGGSGDGKIYKIEVGSVTTNAVNILGDMTVFGSITALGGFVGDGSGLTGITAAQVGAVATNDARYLAALTNVPPLQAVVNAGSTATNIGDLTIAGRVVHGIGLNVANIEASAAGSQQAGRNNSTMTIGISAYGAQQAGYNDGTMTIGTGADGAQQAGRNDNTMTIGTTAYGAQQAGYNDGTMTIGFSAYGAQQRGSVNGAAYATNNGAGAVQLLNLIPGQSATITSAGDASLGLGACVVSNKNSIVAGDDQVSHGDGSITAGGGFFGNGAGITNITAAQVGAIATNDARYLTGWEDLSFPTESIYAFGLTDIEYNVPSNSILFKTTCNTNFSTDHVWLVGQLPHSAKTNAANCRPHIHYAQSSSTQTNMFLIRYKTYKIGEQIPSTWTDIRLTNNAYAYTTGTIHQVAYGDNIPGPFGLSQNFDIKIWSRGGVACHLKFFDIHYQEDSFGSDAEYSKSF